MAVIRPFKGIIPAAGQAQTIASLPYDVFSRSEAAAQVAQNPGSFLAIDRAETSFPDTTDMYSDRVYERAAHLFQNILVEKRLIQDDDPCLYLYALTMDGRTQTGIVACSCVDDYLDGTIKRHENTRADKELDRIRHVDALSAQTGPIFLAYRPDPLLKSLVEEQKKSLPLFDFTSEDKIRHQGWRIKDRDVIGKVVRRFEEIGSTYIADGHHRAASAVRVAQMRREKYPDYTGQEEFNFFLSVLFASDELHIMDYNRIVLDRNGLTPDRIISRVTETFDVVPAGKLPVSPERKGEIGMYMDHIWYRLTVKENLIPTDPVAGLDVSLLQDHVLSPLFGIQDPKTDSRILFAGGIRGLDYLQKEADKHGGVAFAMYPTSMEELLHVADANLLMPPKSTWFEPKLRSGLFIHSFER